MLRRSLPRLPVSVVLVVAVLALGGCERRGGCTGANCGTLINAAVAEPGTLLPPSSEDIVSNDIGEQLFLKLADVGMSENTLGDEDFQALLAQKWEWDGPLTLVFHLDPRARWQDGRPVTAADVEFTFNAYTDSAVASPYRPKLRRIASVTQRDSLTAVFRFRDRYPEMFYDAVYHMRILPAHLLRPVPRDQWKTAPFGRQPVGDGPYRFVRWQTAQSIELIADSTFFLGRPGIRRLIWRFTPNLQVAVQQVIADQADMREQLVTPENVERARAAKQLAVYPFRGSVFTYLCFNSRAGDDTTQPHPIFADREVRRALTMAVDRASLVKSALGDLGKVPPGPMSSLLGIWDPDIRQLPYDTAQAGRVLTFHGWRDHDGDGIRDKNGQPLAFHILVPTSSVLRRQYARLLQQQFGAIGVHVEIDELEPTVVNQRAATGKFDTVILSRQNDPSPSSGITQSWTRAESGGSNYCRYYSPEFEGLVDRAVTASTRDQARALWRRAMETINADAPGIFLYALENVAAVHKRVENVQLRPDSWAALLRTWRIPPDRLIDRDRVER
ncbi:MAG TPA: ABC transporter substrate-binding protein [Gemmatimonadales bacterium]|nr:ABC transporter substrate-binding protein [Gemmatimonadales bacterium]